jgi:Protein of unknown function (DUF3311)
MVDRRYGTESPDRYNTPPSPPHAWPPPVRPPGPPRQSRTLRGFFRRPDSHPSNWLLLVPIVVPLMPFLYNRVEPTLIGIPFFYWSQLGFAFLASVIIAVVHTRTR